MFGLTAARHAGIHWIVSAPEPLGGPMVKRPRDFAAFAASGARGGQLGTGKTPPPRCLVKFTVVNKY
ncbi:hypothetical protein Acsp05_65330 [Actinokineospora sp. NBRC 105648]|nr:hypothetical protein Acsp05_65330 [Actinokineospora sp. NBRC 105648]